MDSRLRIQGLLDQIPVLNQTEQTNTNNNNQQHDHIEDDFFQPYHTRSVSQQQQQQPTTTTKNYSPPPAAATSSNDQQQQQQPLTSAVHNLSAAALGNNNNQNQNQNQNQNNNNMVGNSRSTSIQALQQQQQQAPTTNTHPESRRLSIQQQIQNQLAVMQNLTSASNNNNQQQQPTPQQLPPPQPVQRYPSRERTGSAVAFQQQQQQRRSESSSNPTIPQSSSAGNQTTENQQQTLQSFTQLCRSRPQEAAHQLTSWKKHAAATSEALQLAYAEMAELKEELAKRNENYSDSGIDGVVDQQQNTTRTILDGVDEIRIGRARCILPLSICLKEQQEAILQDHDDYMEYLERTDQRNMVPNSNPSRKYNSLQESIASAVILTVTPQAIFFDEIVGLHHDDDEALAGQSPDGSDEVEPLAELPLHEIDTVVNSDDAFSASSSRNQQQNSVRVTKTKARVIVDIITNSGTQICVEFTNDLSELVEEAEESYDVDDNNDMHQQRNKKNKKSNKSGGRDIHRASARAAALATTLRRWHPRIIDAAEQSRVAQVRNQNNNSRSTSNQVQLQQQQVVIKKGQKPPLLLKNQTVKTQRKANTPAIVGTTRSQELKMNRVGKGTGGSYSSGKGRTSSSSNTKPASSFSPRLPENKDWSPNELLWAVEDIVDGRAEYNTRSTSSHQLMMNQQQQQKTNSYANKSKNNQDMMLQQIPSPLLSRERQRSTSSSHSRHTHHTTHSSTVSAHQQHQQHSSSSILNASNNNRNSLHAFTVVRAHTPTGLAVVHDPEGNYHSLEDATRAAGGVGLLSEDDQSNFETVGGVITTSDRDAVRKQWMRVFGSTYNERTIQAKSRTLPPHVVELGATVDDQYHQDPASELLGVRRPTPKVHHQQHGAMTSSRSNSTRSGHQHSGTDPYYYGNNNQNDLSDADIILANVRGAADAGIMAQPLPSSVNSLRRSAQRGNSSEASESVPRSNNNIQASPTPIFRDLSRERGYQHQQDQQEQQQQQTPRQPTSQNQALQSIVNSQQQRQQQPQQQQQSTPQQQQPPQTVAPSPKPSLLAPKSLAERHIPSSSSTMNNNPPSPSINTAAPTPITAMSASIPTTSQQQQTIPTTTTTTIAAPSPQKKLLPVPTKSVTPSPAPKKSPMSGGGGGGGGMTGVMAELLAKRKPVEPVATTTTPTTTTTAETTPTPTPAPKPAAKKMPAIPTPGKKLPPPPGAGGAAKKAPAASAGPGGMAGVMAELLAKRKPVE